MSTAELAEGAESAQAQTTVYTPLYRAIWRWHFYAGLIVLPFMILLAVTGGVYLFKDEINAVLYREVLTVTPQDGVTLNPSQIVAKASEFAPGQVVSYVPPALPSDSAAVTVDTEASGKIRVYVDPYNGQVLGQLSDSGFARTPLMLLMRKVHSLNYFGEAPNRIIEIVGGWALVLVVTGFYLWWPRGRNVGVFTIRTKAAPRTVWRDVHVVTGAYAGLFIFFLAITGMPWSGVWGKYVNIYADQAGLGYPPEYWSEVPKSKVPMVEGMSQTAWALENTPMPVSTPNGAAPIGIDQAVAAFDGLGIHKGYVIDFPGGAQGVFSASVFPDQIIGEKIIHLDQYSGAPLFNGGFADLGIVGKSIEWGVSVHMGQEFGIINQWLMALSCLAIVVMSVAGIVMWWKRKPQGALGAPRYPADFRIPRALLVIALVVGMVFPLSGLSLVAVLVVDCLLPKRWKEKLA
ncbi:MAG: PepSY domain-containing protein [Rhodospirillales bacterium]|nr:PepSY domain-containing protein [Rhodospirillales bacterium]